MHSKTSLLSDQILHSKTLASGDYYFPKKGAKWESKAPEYFGMNVHKLKQAVEFALVHEHTGDRNLKLAISSWFQQVRREPYYRMIGPTKKRGSPCGVVLKNGYMVARWGNIKRIDMACSITKSFLSSVVALALDEKLIRSLQDKMGQYLHDGKFTDDHNSKITWEHMLTQSSDWYGELWGGYDWAERPPKIGTLEDWKRRKLNEPGTFFKYNNVRVNLMAYVLLHLWRKPLPEVLKKHIMDPIGASESWRWHGYNNSWATIDGEKMKSVSGGGHWGGGLFISAEDLARYGLLFLNNGNWNGQQLFAPDWVKRATTPSRANPNYGYMWWLNIKSMIPIQGKIRHWEGVPENVFYASGFGGNLVVIDPDNDLVIVTRWLEPSQNAEMIRRVLEAL